MKPGVRWTVASLVTIVTFAVASWLAGALLLPPFMKDPAIRWGLAGGFGVAVAALAALWGHSFAVVERPSELVADGDQDAAAKAVTTQAGSTHNEISGGIFHGPVIQGRDFSEQAFIGDVTIRQVPDPETKG